MMKVKKRKKKEKAAKGTANKNFKSSTVLNEIGRIDRRLELDGTQRFL